MTCCGHCQDAEDVFTRRDAIRELRRYRRKGPPGTTKMLLDCVRRLGVRDRTLLDIGGGVGAIQHELFGNGLAAAVHVDASPAYLEASRQEAERRGNGAAVRHVFGDFVDLAPKLDAADIVTLDRVICCYPYMERLVGASLDKARRIYGLVYPRERWATRVGVRLANLYFFVRRSAFRTYLHPAAAVDALVRARGFRPVEERRSFLWRVVTYEREREAA